MDELELLKKDWKKTENSYPSLSYDEIYKMTLKKSSSTVKWIFIISLIELGIGLLLSLINPSIKNSVEFPLWIEILSYISIPIIIYFIYQFYRNYKTITTTDNVKKLMSSILKTRRTVKYYVLLNLIFAAIVSSVGAFIGYINIKGGFESFNQTASFSEYFILIVVIISITILILSVIYGIYYLLYGILLKRLNKNYKELKKIGSLTS